LDNHNGVVPDLAFVASERSFILERDDFVDGVPDIMFEIISPGSVRRDRIEKKALYEQFGVKEYWLIDSANRAVEIYTLQENAYSLNQFLEETGLAVSTILSGFEINIGELFQ
jgi:Uma2 family endonuclease